MVGSTLGTFRIVEKIGEGGMGAVYKARDLQLDRFVAIKVLLEDVLDNEDRRRRFVQEARAASALNHPNIVTIHHVELNAEPYYIVMELVDGQPLHEFVASKGGKLPLQESLRIAVQVADALAAAHTARIVHRDLKPGNILISSGRHVKVLDFGLAKPLTPRPIAVEDTTVTLNQPPTDLGVILGSVPYMSPEQAQGLAVDERSDIFSFGIVLYEMLCGERPFGGPNSMATLSSILKDEPKPISQLTNSVPVELERLVGRCLRKEVERRSQSISDIKLALEELRDDSEPGRRVVSGLEPTPSTRQTLHPPQARFRRAYLLGAALILAVVSFVTWRALSSGRSISSLVILPLRPLSQEATDSLLGLGIADALITKIGQTGQLQVRPISAVSKYAKEDSDPLEAARHLDAETVLAGSLQQSEGHIRVSVQLLRTATGETIWTQSFNTPSGDVFTVQDEIARQVARELSLKLDGGQRRDFEKRSTANPQAFEFYSKGLYHLANRMRGNSDELLLAIELLKKAVELDPSYALAHAQLGWASARYGVFITDDAKDIDFATKHLAQAEELDPRIAQIHAARSFIIYSRHGNWNLRAGTLEARTALRLDPNTGHAELAYCYAHIGLEALAAKHLDAALLADPDNESQKANAVGIRYISLLADEGAAAEQKLFHRSPSVEFYLIKGMVNEAAPLVAKEYADIPLSRQPRVHRAQLYALQGKYAAAATEIAAVEITAEKAPRTLPFHHTAYGIAQVRARMGDAVRALHWLQITVDTGWPQYPMMARDHMLDPVRNDPAVAKFLASLKKTWENNVREFGNEDQ